MTTVKYPWLLSRGSNADPVPDDIDSDTAMREYPRDGSTETYWTSSINVRAGTPNNQTTLTQIQGVFSDIVFNDFEFADLSEPAALVLVARAYVGPNSDGANANPPGTTWTPMNWEFPFIDAPAWPRSFELDADGSWTTYRIPVDLSEIAPLIENPGYITHTQNPSYTAEAILPGQVGGYFLDVAEVYLEAQLEDVVPITPTITATAKRPVRTFVKGRR